ncbi:hypothetical protein [Methylophilus sp. Leaf414]|uniref:hypothetical protein n=1 Tax=Methylophilus sp. Leaf414 TaxID=1736371 RepID=UPI0006FFD398|nr:hypothetical protein [Methylophilus sp. Leaf414]KQT33278.1 hypothetical protein ASG24_13390 [Methylophilus sp. Leaf414]
MDPTTILSAINAAKVAIDTAVKVKDNFFGPTASSKSSSTTAAKASATVDALQSEIELHKKRFDELAAFVEENRTIVQEQNEIIIGLSNALKVTAETVQRQRVITFVMALISTVAILVSVYALVH